MQRILIIGSAGAGKTTLALAMAPRTGLPVFHLDRYAMLPSRLPRTPEARLAIYAAIMAGDRWIIEGYHPTAQKVLAARADTVICMDFGILVRLQRLCQRQLENVGKQRADMPDGCPDLPLWRMSRMLRRVWRTRHTARKWPLAIAKAPPPGLRVLHLRSDSDVQDFLAGLPQ